MNVVWYQFCCLNMHSGHGKLLDMGLLDTQGITVYVCGGCWSLVNLVSLGTRIQCVLHGPD